MSDSDGMSGGLSVFARGDRVFPVDDVGAGVWSRRGTVLAVHDGGRGRMPGIGVTTYGHAAGAEVPPPARATVLWDDGMAEILGEDQLCLVYDQVDQVGIRVVTAAIPEPVDLVQHGGQVVLVLRDGLLGAGELTVLRDRLRRVRASLVPEIGGPPTPAESRRRDLDLLRALVGQLTARVPTDDADPTIS